MENNSPAYLVGQFRIKDSDKWARYRAVAPETLVPWQGQLIFIGQKSSLYSGEHGYDDAVVFQFPDQSAMDSWFNSAAYQALIPLRQEAADMVLIGYRTDNKS